MRLESRLVLITGSTTGVSSISKRDNPGLQFLDCPDNITSKTLEHVHTARAICMDRSLDECFQVRENRAKGAIVHMPSECGASGFARAVSLTPSWNQSIPVDLALGNPVSAVYDFKFDYNMNLAIRLKTMADTGQAVSFDGYMETKAVA
ncbi:hypothetical protein BDW69DRAFT_189758 [Aspergillus filifer]